MRGSPYRARYINGDKVALARQLRRDMTPTEKMLWERLRANRLNGLHFRRQVVIEGYVADFYCHAARLVVEVDGGVHEQQRGYDGLRDQVMKASGYRVLRVTADDVEKDMNAVLSRIAQAAEAL
jgi:very-short-patch-repair endonuclease